MAGGGGDVVGELVGREFSDRGTTIRSGRTSSSSGGVAERCIRADPRPVEATNGGCAWARLTVSWRPACEGRRIPGWRVSSGPLAGPREDDVVECRWRLCSPVDLGPVEYFELPGDGPQRPQWDHNRRPSRAGPQRVPEEMFGLEQAGSSAATDRAVVSVEEQVVPGGRCGSCGKRD